MEIVKIKKGKPYLLTDVQKWGGKGDNLLKLSEVFNVPEGFIVSADFSTEWMQSSKLKDAVDEYLRSECSENDFEKLKNGFRGTKINQRDAETISKSLEGLVGPFAVRSSDVDEDGNKNSFAGQRDTILGPEKPEEVILAYKEVVASLFTPRSIEYIRKQGLTPSRSIAVAVQRLVDAKSSGVAYSPSPNNQTEILIESTWGLCTSIVDGRPCDIYRVLDTVTGNVVQDISPKKREMDVFNSRKRKVETAKVPFWKIGKSSLGKEQVIEVAKTVKSIERAYDCPMDMEFAFDDKSGSLYVLQARPLTGISLNERQITLQNIPANRILARTKNTRNQGIFEGPAVVVGGVDHVNRTFNIDGDLIQMNKDFASGYVLIAPEVPSQLEQHVTNARGMYATECGTTGHAAAIACEKGIVYLGRGINSVPDLLATIRSGDRVGIAASKDEGILYRL